MVEELFQTFSQIIGHMIEIENEVGEILIFYCDTYKLVENLRRKKHFKI